MLRLGKDAVTTTTVALAALLPVLAIYFTATPSEELVESELPTAVVSLATPTFDPAYVTDDVLWLARCIYSETKKAHEQELVAWVIRNRVETGYRGESTYEGTVLDPYQFSAFNPGSSKRRLYATLASREQLGQFREGAPRSPRRLLRVVRGASVPRDHAPLLQRALDGRRQGAALGRGRAARHACQASRRSQAVPVLFRTGIDGPPLGRGTTQDPRPEPSRERARPTGRARFFCLPPPAR